MAAPTYQAFNKSVQDYIDPAKQSVSGRYDTRIAGEQSNIPLIQQQYANLANTIQTEQQQQEGAMKKGAETSIGSNRVANAKRGVFSSSENRADERNVRTGLDTNVSNLAANVANRLAGVNTEQSQQVNTIQNIIRNLEQDKEADINKSAWSMYDADYQKHDKNQDRVLDAYWKEQSAQQAREQAAFDRMVADRSYALQSRNATNDDANTKANATSELMSGLMASVPEGANAQDYVYRQIQQNSNLWAKQGINVEDLWQVWRNMNYGSTYGTGKLQGYYNASETQATNKNSPTIGSAFKSGGLGTTGLQVKYR